MTVDLCIIGKAEAGTVNREKAERLANTYRTLERRYRGAEGEAAREHAALDAATIAEREIKNRKRRKLMGLRAQTSIIARAQANPTIVDQAMMSVLEFDPRRRVSGPNVETLKDVHRGRAHALMADFIERFRSKTAGLTRRTAGLNDIVSEMFGRSTNNPEARALAGGISEAMEYLRNTLNRYGADIPKRDDWGLPQIHSRRAVAEASKDEWITFTFERLNREKMIDLDTGKPMDDDRLLDVLGGVYDTIATNGLRDIAPGEFLSGGGIIGRRQESRFLVFRDPETWMEYHERFGEGNIFNILLGHVEGMSRDIAITQVMGPNPEATLRLMENLVDKATADSAVSGTGKAAARAAARIGAPSPLRSVWQVVNGDSGIAANQTVANVAAANRNVLTAAMLGGAFISAISDVTFARITAKLNGIPASGALGRHMRNFLPGGQANRMAAIRAGFGAQGWASRAIAAQRYLGEVIGPEWSEKTADTVLRASLLSPWTDAGRWAFTTEFLGFLTDNAGKNFDELLPALQRSMAGHGVTPKDWDTYRATRAWADEESGATFIRPQDIAAAGNVEAADRIQSMILTEMEFAVPSATARTRAMLTGGTRPGTLWGEITRNTTLFKSFPVTLVQTHLNRMAFGNITTAEKGRYLAQLVIGLGVMGALAAQTKQIVAGKDPIPMDPSTEEGRKFWMKAMLQGGGAGIFGDFLFSDVNRFGSGLGDTLLGPVFGSQRSALEKLTIGNLQELFQEGEAKDAGRELFRFAEMMTPGRSLWYSRLALERLVLDEIERTLDPDAPRRWAQYENRLRRETGQNYWSRPGTGADVTRAPQLENALR